MNWVKRSLNNQSEGINLETQYISNWDREYQQLKKEEKRLEDKIAEHPISIDDPIRIRIRVDKEGDKLLPTDQDLSLIKAQNDLEKLQKDLEYTRGQLLSAKNRNSFLQKKKKNLFYSKDVKNWTGLAKRENDEIEEEAAAQAALVAEIEAAERRAAERAEEEEEREEEEEERIEDEEEFEEEFEAAVLRSRLMRQNRERLEQIARAERLADELAHEMAAAHDVAPTLSSAEIDARVLRGPLLPMDGYDSGGDYGRGKRKTLCSNTRRGNTHRGNTRRGNTRRGNTHRGNTHRGNTHRGNTRRGNTRRKKRKHKKTRGKKKK